MLLGDRHAWKYAAGALKRFIRSILLALCLFTVIYPCGSAGLVFDALLPFSIAYTLGSASAFFLRNLERWLHYPPHEFTVISALITVGRLSQ